MKKKKKNRTRTQPNLLSLFSEYLLSRTEIERAVAAAKASVDAAYKYSREA